MTIEEKFESAQSNVNKLKEIIEKLKNFSNHESIEIVLSLNLNFGEVESPLFLKIRHYHTGDLAFIFCQRGMIHFYDIDMNLLALSNDSNTIAMNVSDWINKFSEN